MALPGVDFPTLGFQVIDWIETYLVHGPGDVQGQDIELDDEFALHFCWAYRVWPKEHELAGQRVFRRVVLSRAKGRSKSEAAGMAVCVEALGPVRCDGFDANGDPVGIPITYPYIRCLATEEGQAGNTYDNVFTMLTEGEAANEYAVDVGLTRTFIKEPGGGVILPSTASSAAKDGGKETFGVADETHLYVLPELRRMHSTVRRNLRKRKIAQPWMLDTTTAWQPGEMSIAEQAAERWGTLTPAQMVARGVLYDHREAPNVKRWGSDKELLAALKIAYGPAAEWMDLRGIVAEIRDSDEAEAKRYWLNQAVATKSNWVTPAELRRIAKPEIEVAAGTQITLGFDGSRTRDATGLVGCRLEDGHLFVIDVWERPEGREGEGWEVPAEEVHAAVRGAFETFEVERMYADPPYWQSEVDEWHAEYPDQVIAFWTNQLTRMARAVGALRTGLRGAQVTYDGNDRFTEHLLNARRLKVRARLEDEAEEAHVIQKDRQNSPRKIDLAAAAVLAHEARGDAIADGALKRRKRSRVPMSFTH